jgi:sigma-E factor negative regulatory protein RseA
MMNEQNEKLSAVMDDFQANEEEQKALNELLADINQRNTLSRYQLIGDAMRNEIPSQIRLGFAADVMSQIAQEPSLKPPAKKKRITEPEISSLWSWLFKPVAGLAVAAAVAVITISTFQSTQLTNSQPDQLANADASKAKVEMLTQIPVMQNNAQLVSTAAFPRKVVNGMNWKIKRNEPAVQNKLNLYLINHNEYSNSMSGIIPQARVVGFDDQK